MSANNVEGVYPLSPMQQGMLFHSLYSPDSGTYITQISCSLHGSLDVQSFIKSWQRVLERHAVLRTAFVWEGMDEPLQAVGQRVKLPWEQYDWRALTPEVQQAQLEAYLQSDRAQGFKLSRAPLMRLRLIQLADDVHVLIWSHHHVLLDGWSAALVFNEVFAFYLGFCKGQEQALPRPRPYADYIAWLRKQSLQQAETFWRRTLDGFTTPTPLAVDKALGGLAHQTTAYDQRQLRVSEADTTSLQVLVRQHQLTINTLVQGAWALLLSCYSGERDVLFGATVSGRPSDLAGVERMVGLFINTLPVRVAVEPGRPLLAWLKTIQAQQLEARQYEYSPLAQVHGWSKVSKSLPLFESLLVFENYPIDTSVGDHLGGLEIRALPSIERTNYPLTVIVVPGTELLLRIIYDSDRFETETIDRMLGHLQQLLHGMLAEIDRPVGSLSLLSRAERVQLLEEWNRQPASREPAGCIHTLFESQCARTPDALALVANGCTITYSELNAKANQLAHHLRGLGVGPEVRVGVCLERSAALVVSLLAVLKAGGGYVPLDPAYPAERLQYMLDDSQASVLISRQTLVGSLSPLPTLVCLDRDTATIARCSSENVVSGVTSAHLAYIIYTSGSTGQPKGVAIAHQSTVVLLAWAREQFGAEALAGVLAGTSVCFDLSLFELFGPLSWGGTVLLAEDVLHIPSLRGEQPITLINTVPSAISELLRSQQLPSTVQVINLAGEALQHNLVTQLYAQTNVQGIYNLYGPTEDTTYSTGALVEREGVGPAAIGRPLPYTQAYVLDEQLQLVPVGVVGLLYLSGAGLARGYYNRPHLTAERFIPNPYGAPGSRMYATGDRVRYRTDGMLEYVGRGDHQVKVRGFRIELGEIEAVLKGHPDVRDAVVVAREDRVGEKRLVAYVVPSFTRASLQDELRRYLRDRLPAYMVPGMFVILDALPLTPNGKVDRKALPSPDSMMTERDNAYVAPQTTAEETLAAIWANVLGRERVGVHDNFFALGGDSILSIQVVARAKEAGLHLTPRQIFLHPTVSELAATIGAPQQMQAEQGLVSGSVALTPIQHWFFTQAQPDHHHFNQALLLVPQQPLMPDLLEQAVHALVRHHDALRLRFTERESGWHQTNAAVEEHALVTHVDLAAVPDLQVAAEIERIANETQQQLDLMHGPLMRVVHVGLGKEHSERLLIVIHHLAVDGVSWRILLEDLEVIYQQLQRGAAIQLPPKTTSFKQWAERLHAYAQTETIRTELSYWASPSRKEIDPLPQDYPGGANEVGSTNTVTVELNVDETRALLQEVPQVYRTQINDVLLTALVQALSRWTGVRMVLVDLEGHGRVELFPDVDLSRTVGWFTTLYPVVLDLGAQPGPAAALKAIKEQLRAVPQQGIGYGLLRYLCTDAEVRGCLEKLPQAEVIFNYLGQLDQALGAENMFTLAAESSGHPQSVRARRAHLLDVTAIVLDGRLRIGWSFSAQVYRVATIERLVQSYADTLRGLIAHCLGAEESEYTASDFPLANIEQHQLNKLASKLKKTGSKLPR